MYGMKPKFMFIERALDMLFERPDGGLVVVFHCDRSLQFDGSTCHRTASFPIAVIRVADNDELLDCFASFVAGFVLQDMDADRAVRVEWRKTCRALGRREEHHPGSLVFSSPNIMIAFNQHATKLAELKARVPWPSGAERVRNREARLHHPAATVRPTELRHVQQCVLWALKHRVS